VRRGHQQRNAAKIVLFVSDVGPGGNETVNCGANTVAWKDTL
jgi:hypothetical protein